MGLSPYQVRRVLGGAKLPCSAASTAKRQAANASRRRRVRRVVDEVVRKSIDSLLYILPDIHPEEVIIVDMEVFDSRFFLIDQN